jgi:WS/DGAT/MGAT family acyltransferase
MPHDRLTPLDTSFLHLENPHQPMHVGGVMIFEGDAPPYADFVDHVRARLSMVPRYRQKLALVPLWQGRPKWVDDESFDLPFHVRATALPRPGGEHELKVLAARVFAQPLNREKPLWEMWLVEGLEGNRFAVVSKTHHSVVDGVSGLDILSVLFSPEDESSREASLEWRPRPAPSRLSLLAEALVERATMPAEAVRPLRALVRRPRTALGKVYETAAALGAFAFAGITPAPRTPYNSRMVGVNRRITWMRGDLETVKAIKNELDGTVNDVILTVVTRALRKHLQARGERTDDVTLKAFVPVSVRGDADRGGEKLGNQVAGMIAPLPVGCEDPRTCLEEISRAMSGLKKSGQAVGARTLTELTGFAPPNILDQASRIQIGQPFVNLVVTNVPGPQFPLYMGDRELLDIVPLVPIGNNMNLVVGIVSYNGRIDIGLVGDFDALPDLELLGDLFGEALAEMADVAGVTREPAPVEPAPVEPAPVEPATVEPATVEPVTNGQRFESSARAPFPRSHIDTTDELVESAGERGAEETPGPEIYVEEPWEGYSRMKVPEIRDRLVAASSAAAGLVEMYERSHRGRRQVLEAAERAQRTG